MERSSVRGKWVKMWNSQNMDFKEYTNKELAEMILALEKRIKKLEKSSINVRR